MLISPKNFFKAMNDAMVFLWEVTRSPVDWYLGLSDGGRQTLQHNVWYVLLILGGGTYYRALAQAVYYLALGI